MPVYFSDTDTGTRTGAGIVIDALMTSHFQSILVPKPNRYFERQDWQYER